MLNTAELLPRLLRLCKAGGVADCVFVFCELYFLLTYLTWILWINHVLFSKSTKNKENVALDLGRGPLLGADKAIDTEMENFQIWQRCVFALL